MSVRSAIFDGPGRPLRFACVAPPRLAPGEVLVRVSLCTVCGSDLHTFAGRRTQPVPSVLGHEPVGVVEEVNGELRDVNGEPVRVGDRVVWSVAVSCGACFFCTHGLPQKCARLRKYGHEPANATTGPLGGLSTHCHLLANTAIVKVPAELPDAVAAPAGCATATVMAAFRAAQRNLTPQPPSLRGKGALVSSPSPLGGGVGEGSSRTVAVIGLGILGLTACAVASAAGDVVIACDVSDTRLARAARFGATHFAKPDELVGVAAALTCRDAGLLPDRRPADRSADRRPGSAEPAEGRGADLALELSGSADASRLSLAVLRVGGTAVWVGAVSPVGTIPVDVEAVVRRCQTVAGVHNYAPGDLAAAIAFLTANHSRFPFADLVAETFSLADADAAFAFAETERPVRVGVRCG
jgi:putative phosphonate catabolism associated alcohol dehydrogenase